VFVLQKSQLKPIYIYVRPEAVRYGNFDIFWDHFY